MAGGSPWEVKRRGVSAVWFLKGKGLQNLDGYWDDEPDVEAGRSGELCEPQREWNRTFHNAGLVELDPPKGKRALSMAG